MKAEAVGSCGYKILQSCAGSRRAVERLLFHRGTHGFHVAGTSKWGSRTLNVHGSWRCRNVLGQNYHAAEEVYNTEARLGARGLKNSKTF